MKSELKVFGFVALVSILLVASYSIMLSKNVGYSMTKNTNSTANYVVVEGDKDELKDKEEEEISTSEEEIEPEKEIVYDGLTLDELSEKINRSLNSTISGKGYLIASYSLEMGVDPYMATAIILHETGCKWDCSYLVKSCNNVGGQKGSGCGSYSYFESLDSGIIAFINNLSKNYINYGLVTPEQINTKYASDTNWATNVNKYIEIIKAQ